MVAEIIERQDGFRFNKFIELPKVGQVLDTWIKGIRLETESDETMKWLIGIGENSLRKRIAELLLTEIPELTIHTCIDPSSVVFSSALVEQGSVIMPGTVIAANAKIGKHCIVNTNSSIDHDSRMNDFSSVGPNSSMSGRATLGSLSHLGVGANVIQGLSVGHNSVVGAGGIVTQDIGSNSVFMGVPAKFIRAREHGEAIY